jgi:inhibitor of cysteine peptidase
MNKKEQYQMLGIVLVSILVVASVSYVAMFQQSGPITTTTYEVKNFDSYHTLTSFLQASNEKVMNSNTQGNLPAPSRVGSNVVTSGLATDEKATQGGQTVDYSKTNIQVPGVDEPDIVKTDGTYLYIVSGNKVLIIRATPAANASIQATITVAENLTIQNIFVNGTRLVIFAQSSVNYPILYDSGMDALKKESISSIMPWYSSPDTYIKIYDLTTISAPEQVKEIIVGGYLSDARLIGAYIYVITTQYTYNTQTLDANTSIVPRLTLNAQVVDIPLADIYYIDSPEKSSTLTNVISVNIHNDDEQIHAKIFLLGTSQNVYVSQENIYITYSSWSYYDYTQLQKLVDDIILPILPESVKTQLESVKTLDLQDYQKQEITFWILQNYAQNTMPEAQKKQLTRDLIRQTEQTIIHRISIHDGEITYMVQGSVPGYINNQFSLDEYNGYLRVATTIQGSSVSYIFGSINPETNLYVLDMDLQTIGSLEDITPDSGESIYATRFVGPTCYIVTFKQTDPFMVIDLSNPTTLTILGELQIPGYSTYLHPYDETHVIGIGRNNTAVKIALYDITSMSNPVEVSQYIIENSDKDSYWWTESTALYEHKAFLFDKEKGILVIPAGNYSQQSAYVFGISLQNGLALKGIVTHDYQAAEQDTTYYWGTSGNSIQRSLFIENTLYTISNNMVKMNDLDSLAQLNSIPLVP